MYQGGKGETDLKGRLKCTLCINYTIMFSSLFKQEIIFKKMKMIDV